LNKISIQKKTFSQFWISDIRKITDHMIDDIQYEYQFPSTGFKKFSIYLRWTWSIDLDTKHEVFKYLHALIPSVRRDIIIREFTWFDMKYDPEANKKFRKYTFINYKFRAWELFQF
jgi:hypothetical protein